MQKIRKQNIKSESSDDKHISDPEKNQINGNDLVNYSQKKLDEEAYRISLGYIFTTTTLAIALIASYFILAQSMKTQDVYLALISTSSAQQILYQQTYQRASDIKEAISEEQGNLNLLEQIRRRLQEEIQDLEKNQVLMKTLISKLNDPVATEYFYKIYNEEPYLLTERQEEYALRIRQVIDAKPARLLQGTNIWIPIDAISGSQGILSKGYKAVIDEGNKRILIHTDKLHKYQRTIAGALIVILLLEVFFIFKPLVISLKKTHKQVIDTQLAIQKTQRMEAIGQVATGLAHEFNNFLASISTNAEIALARIKPSSTVFEPLKSIIRLSKSSALLSRRLLTLSRQDTSQRTNLYWNDVLHENEDLLKQICGQNIKLIIKTDANLWPVLINENEALQIILNLLINSRDAINDLEGEIIISTENISRSKEGSVRLIIKDNGVGISEELKDKIFEYFFTTKPVGLGTGLGLPNIAEIVKLNNGEIEVESTLGEGAEFRILFPRSSLEVIKEPEVETINHQDSLGDNRFKILVVDDNAAVLSASVSLISELGYEAVGVTNGIDALECMDKQAFSHVITDVNMLNMTGIKLSEKIEKKWPDMPVILSSGLGLEEVYSVDNAKKRYFLSKPYDVEELQEVLMQSTTTNM